ncbi:MAG: LruC domain-containing protein [Deltaproteobacteria bacterium]
MFRLRGLCGALFTLAFTTTAFAQDSDQDGAPDAADAYPCAPSAAGHAFAPARDTFGQLLFEDEFPDGGDYDFNDVVLGYNVALQLDAQGQAVALRYALSVIAAGGARASGLGIHLPVGVADVASVTRTIDQTTTAISPRLDNELTFDVAPNLHALFGANGPINVTSAMARTPVAIRVDVAFARPVVLDFAEAPFDVFVYESAAPSREIHRTRYAGTATMNTSLFNTGADNSGNGRWYVDTRGVPFVLELPQLAAHPYENTDVAQLWPDILSFAASGGATHTTFYSSNVATAFAWSDGAGQTVEPAAVPRPEFVVDTACLPVEQVFTYTGAPQTFVVPAGVTSIDAVLIGAPGATVDGLRRGGRGGRVTATLPVTPGETLYVYVGGNGLRPQGGYNGGGFGNGSNSLASGGGGGATDIRRGGTSLMDRVLVAGGGGGGGAGPGSRQHGGNGGGTVGYAGSSSYAESPPGQGGTQTAGGAGGDAGNNTRNQENVGRDGSFGQGGNGGRATGAFYPVGGGGGGGWFGGGGGGVRYCCGSGGAGGGGGAGYAAPGTTNVFMGIEYTVQEGRAILSW